MVFRRNDSEGNPLPGWWFRDKKDLLAGPFATEVIAEMAYENDRNPIAGRDEMIYPVFERSSMWWYRDDETDTEYGPFSTREEAIEAYEEYLGFPED